jgi:ABC-type lipoprotein release transport system permease subunit
MASEKSDLLQGTLDMLVLKIVALDPAHGYGIAHRIQQISRAVLQVQQATCGSIIKLVLREVAMLLLPGCAVGALAAAGLARFASSFLFGVTPTDPLTFALALCALASATLAAGYLPALRAARIDPIAALRCD